MSKIAVDAHNLMTAIQTRRSFKIAGLKPDPVAREIVETILEAARWAPSHGQTEPWRYTVFTGESRGELGEVFAEAYRLGTAEKGNFAQSAFETHRDKVWNAPVWIAIALTPALRPDGTPAMPPEEELLALACSVQNLHLMAAALGLGGQWTTNFTAMHPHTAQWLGLQPPARLMGFFFLGWPAIEWPRGNRRPLEESVRWVGGG